MKLSPCLRINTSDFAVSEVVNVDGDDCLNTARGRDRQIDAPCRATVTILFNVFDLPRVNIGGVGHVSSSLVRLALTKVAAWAGRVIARGPSVLASHTSEAA